MDLTAAERELRDRYFHALLEATFSLAAGPDQEQALQALLRATDLLRERLEQELAELRVEAVD